MLRIKATRKDNMGFTLLEVLVAMAILTIISVPLLRAFATSAFTNRKAKIEMVCTTASENLAEDFRDVPVDDIIDDFSAIKVDDFTSDPTNPDDNRYMVNADGTYTFEIRNLADMRSNLPEGFYATVDLDPTYYPNANSLNLSQIEPVSLKDSAIYTMADDLDAKAYKIFEERSADAKALDSTKEQHDAAWFKDNLTRIITITIDKKGETDVPVKETSSGTPSGAPMKTIDLVKVNLTIEYEIENYSKYFSSSDDGYLKSVNAYLYDNTSSKREFNSVYLFFYPRYAAGEASVGKEPRDRIFIENVGEVKTNVYLTELEGAADAVKKANYHTHKCLNVIVKENPAEITADTKAALTLRTNLNTGVPYSSADTDPAKGKLDMNLVYQNNAGTRKTTSTEQAAKIVKAANTDGKTLDSADTPNRIYKMFVRIFDQNGDEFMTFDGTKLEF